MSSIKLIFQPNLPSYIALHRHNPPLYLNTRISNHVRYAIIIIMERFWVLPRDVWDHCPLVLRVGGWDWGPKPFRFNNYWLKNREFKGVVEEAWRGHNVGGWMSFVLKEKLKVLKHKINEWNKVECGRMDDRVEVLMEQIKGLDEKGEVGGLCDAEILKARDIMVVQRSHSKWLKEGDANSKFFHNCVKSRV